MPYPLQQFTATSSQEGLGYSGTMDNDGAHMNSNTIISPPGNQPTYLPTHLSHHIPPHHHHRHHNHHNINNHHHHFLPSPPASVSSSYSSSSSSISSLSSPTLPQTIPSGYRIQPSSTTPPPRGMSYSYGSERGRLPAPTESEDNDVYPLDLSIRPGPREETSQDPGLGSRQRYMSRIGAAEPSHNKHHATSSSSSISCSSRNQHRLSPYSIPPGRPATGPAHSPSSRSPGPLRTDSPVYNSRRRTPSPAYYPGPIPEGGVYKTSGSAGSAHLHQQHYLTHGPAPPTHLSPSPSLAVQSEHSSSPSPFQILTTADTVLHWAPIVSSLFKPYQDQMDGSIHASLSGYAGKLDRPGEDQTQHQSRDPRRQLLRQLQQQQQQHQNQIQQRPSQQQQQQDEEEERTYVDLDCPQPPRPTYSTSQSEDQACHSGGETSSDQPASTETPMEVTGHAPGSRGLNRQGSVGFGGDNTRREHEQQEDLSPPGPFHQNAELQPKSSVIHDSHHYLRQAFLASSVQDPREIAGIEKAQSYLTTPHFLHKEQHPQQQKLPSDRQEGEEPHCIQQQHAHQQRQSEVDTTTTSCPTETSLAGETTNGDVGNNGKSKANMENLSQEVLEEAKLMAFLSKTTLVTLKPNGQVHKAGTGSPSSDNPSQKGLSSAHNIFKDFHVVSNENNGPGKLPKIDFCLSATPRSGPPTSCKGSVIAPKKICFRLVDLVGLLVEQSLRA